MIRPEALAAAFGGALVVGYAAGAAHVLQHTGHALDMWAWRHGARRVTRRRRARWWLAQLWFAARIAYDLLRTPAATARHIREARQQRRHAPRRPAPPLIVVDPRAAKDSQPEEAQQ
ncbi:hypothetical protein [Streptomyces sp. CC224B]|uniref:hypothetical protein n=1 Tax=Streptomyces sp. CC224B TaxID=3044571 RepID=UPI0024A7BFC0|nr:hypothetical protein [Streptomyces sp. CC224B]